MQVRTPASLPIPASATGVQGRVGTGEAINPIVRIPLRSRLTSPHIGCSDGFGVATSGSAVSRARYSTSIQERTHDLLGHN